MAFSNTRPGLGEKKKGKSMALVGNTSNQGISSLTTTNPLVKALSSNLPVDETKTENGMKTYKSSLNAATDFFFMAAALRKGGRVAQVVNMWLKVWTEDSLLAIKLLFWLRDVRGGAGEKEAFRLVLSHLWGNSIDIFNQVIKYVPEYGSFKDLIPYIEKSKEVRLLFINELVKQNGLAAKWLGRPAGKHLNQANAMIREFNQMGTFSHNHKSYRHLLVELTNVVEQQMCANRWKDIKYESVPSQAMHIYRTAFFKHDATRFQQVIDSANKGEVKLQAGAIFPGDLVAKIGDNSGFGIRPKGLPTSMISAVDAQWKSLPNWLENNPASILVAADVSDSMGQMSAHSVGLALYVAQHIEGPFRNSFMTFSGSSKFYTIQEGSSLSTALSVIKEDNMNTDLKSVFTRLLSVAISNTIKAEDMPKQVIIISDMEFDAVGGKSAFEMVKKEYKKAGYELPALVFWNMASRHDNVPVRTNQEGVKLVSGYSPAIMKSILSAKPMATPTDVMLATINSERYERIVI